MRRDHDLPGAAVVGASPSLDQPRLFQPIDEPDHGARIGAHVGTQLLLDGALAHPDDVQHRKLRRGEANEIERLRRERVRFERGARNNQGPVSGCRLMSREPVRGKLTLSGWRSEKIAQVARKPGSCRTTARERRR